jgi:hypothetical protein
MAPESNSWIPQGTHEVQIGPSLNKALKARKGGPPPQVKRTGPPEKDFYSFRCPSRLGACLLRLMYRR